MPRFFTFIRCLSGVFLCLLMIKFGANAQSPVRILAFGDSLIAGYGLPAQDGFTAQLQQALNDANLPAIVTNAGLSGDTTAGGLSRIEWSLAGGQYDLILLELGANDALRGLDPNQSKINLSNRKLQEKLH